MHVEEQGHVTPATVDKACTYTCSNPGYNKVFFNAHACKCHADRCKFRDHFYLGKIPAVRGDTSSSKREFLVRWEDYGPDDDTWESRQNVSPKQSIKEFLVSNGLYHHARMVRQTLSTLCVNNYVQARAELKFTCSHANGYQYQNPNRILLGHVQPRT